MQNLRTLWLQYVLCVWPHGCSLETFDESPMVILGKSEDLMQVNRRAACKVSPGFTELHAICNAKPETKSPTEFLGIPKCIRGVGPCVCGGGILGEPRSWKGEREGKRIKKEGRNSQRVKHLPCRLGPLAGSPQAQQESRAQASNLLLCCGFPSTLALPPLQVLNPRKRIGNLSFQVGPVIAEFRML